MKAAVYRKEIFSATHRLHNPNWSDEKNIRVFGKCNNPNYHGHNYELVVKVIGDVDPETGYVIDAKVLKDLIKEHVMDRYDHKNLYTDVEDFKDLNPTSENIARKIYENLKSDLAPQLGLQIRIYETSKIYVDYPVT